MAHFAQIDSNNVVTQVIVVSNDDTSDSNGVEVESIGVAFCQKLLGAETNWKQTSYNNNIRGNYAGIGYTYMTNVATLGVGSTDIFISPQPNASWTIGVGTATNIKSDSNTSSIVFKFLLISLSCILISCVGLNPNAIELPTNPFPIIPIFFILLYF